MVVPRHVVVTLYVLLLVMGNTVAGWLTLSNHPRLSFINDYVKPLRGILLCG